jgi:hypothetical protein
MLVISYSLKAHYSKYKLTSPNNDFRRIYHKVFEYSSYKYLNNDFQETHRDSNQS